jgi:hypothetical protein
MAKGSASGMLAVLLIGGLAVALIFGGSILSFVSGLPSFIEDFIGQIRGGLPGAGGSFEGATWIGYTVFYADGTSEDVRQSAPTFSLMPLSITFKNKDVSSVRVDLRAKLSCDKPMGVWAANVSMKTEVFKMSDSVPRTAKTSAIANYSKNGASWGNGEVKVLASYTVQASQLEDLVFTYGDGHWLLQFLGILTLNVSVDGVGVDLPAGVAPSGGMDFNFVNGVPNSLSVTGGSERLGS